MLWHPQATWHYQVCSNTICNNLRKALATFAYISQKTSQISTGAPHNHLKTQDPPSKYPMWDSAHPHSKNQIKSAQLEVSHLSKGILQWLAVNWCCMYKCSCQSVHHLWLHCANIYEIWFLVFSMFGVTLDDCKEGNGRICLLERAVRLIY